MRQQDYYIQKTRLFLAKSIYFNNNILFFLYGSFKNSVSSSDYTAQNGRIIVNASLERIWKEMVMA
jgi:hypothetical protein